MNTCLVSFLWQQWTSKNKSSQSIGWNLLPSFAWCSCNCSKQEWTDGLIKYSVGIILPLRGGKWLCCRCSCSCICTALWYSQWPICWRAVLRRCMMYMPMTFALGLWVIIQHLCMPLRAYIHCFSHLDCVNQQGQQEWHDYLRNCQWSLLSQHANQCFLLRLNGNRLHSCFWM